MSKRKLFHRLVSIDKAIEIIDNNLELKPRGIEKVDILNALNSVLAEDIVSSIDYPPFDRSEVDGFAVRAEDTYGASDIRPIILEVVGSVKVGEEPKRDIGKGKAVEIATGAPIPRGCNAVVMEEYTHRENNYVKIYKSVAPLENITIAGSDIARGELVLPKGVRLGPFELGILAALGYNAVNVYLKPKVAVISTGNEIIKPGSELRYGQLYDYNGFAITMYLRSLGAEVYYLGVVPDDEEELKNVLLHNIDEYDLIVTSGGTSAGVGDIVYRVIEGLGEILIHGLEVKPGKPTIIGVIKGKPVIGLPGFPFSAVTHTITLLRYIVDKLSGVECPTLWHNVKAKIAHKIRKEVGKDLFLPVILTYRGLELIAIPIPFRSGNITPILRLNGVAIIRSGVEVVEEGEVVDVLLQSPLIPETILIGSHDVLLPSILRASRLIHKCRFIPVGSLSGLLSVAKGYGDIAPVHLLDPETSTYNITYVKQYKNIVLVSGYKRKLVLAFKQGNPKNIKGLEDVLRDDVRFVNRNRGSGTRIYIDMMLKKISDEKGISFEELIQRINGYTYEVSSHTGVAAAIAQGRADLGVCIEYAAKLYGLGYIPLTWEEYDFAVNRYSLEIKQTVNKFIEYLRASETKKLINSYPGYEVKNNIGEIILF
ncbi:MAG: molybdopterin biosynthesis protein [Ignisphaera sp.]